ncbi:MAG: hypothetical protein V2B15_08600 [Bacteroidota bacterium]
MITTSLFRDTFEYFARFPLHAGVMEAFNLEASDLFTEEYPAFKAKIENLAEKSLIPGIQDYIFGVDRELVIKRVQDLDGYYLFIDYGNMASERDEYKVKKETLLIAVTVAIPRNPDSMNHIEAVLMADQALDYIRQIRARMLADQRDSPFIQHLTFPNEITPFFARELENSTGFTLLFSKELVDMFGQY